MSIDVLVVEDSEADAELLFVNCGTADTRRLPGVDTPDAMAFAIHGHPWDVIIADYVMPHFSGPEALRMVRNKNLDVPLILYPARSMRMLR